MEVSVCVNSGIKGSIDIPLMVTVTTTEGLASELKQLRFCPCHNFLYKVNNKHINHVTTVTIL